MQIESILIDDIVAAIRAIPEVVTLLGGTASNVSGYKRSYPTNSNLEQAIAELNPPAVMVAHSSTTFGRLIDHRFTLVLKPNGSPDVLFQAIRDGVPTPGYGNVKFKRAQINQTCHPPMIEQYGPRPLPIGEGTFIEVHEVTLSLTERGADD